MSIQEDNVEKFHNSLSRCQATGDFFENFYVRFISSSETVQEKFKNTDMPRQKRILKASLFKIVLASSGDRAAERYLRDLATSHNKENLDISPELYSLWLESLIAVASEADVRWDSDTEKAWRELMSYGIDFMKSRY